MDWWSETTESLGGRLARLRVGVYGSGGAPSHHVALVALWGGSPRVVTANDIRGGALDDLDALLFPGGGLNAMAGQLNPLGPEGARLVKQWVLSGGTYVGSCAGSCHPVRMSDPYRAALPVADEISMCSVTPLNASAGEWGLDSPGTGALRVQREESPLFAGLPDTFEVIHYNGPLFPPAAGATGRVLGPGERFTPFERSAGQDSSAALDAALDAGARISYRESVGAGQVILFGSHPEFGASALQLGWLPAARLLANALGLVEPRGSVRGSTGELSAASLAECLRLTRELRQTLGELLPLGEHLPAGTPPFLGRSGRELWEEAVSESREVLGRLAAFLESLQPGIARGAFLLDREPQPDQDYGFSGLRQLLARAHGAVGAAAASAPADWPAFSTPYAEFLTHPYYQVASVYLSAGGLVAAAALQAEAFAALNGLPAGSVVPLTA
ncbi:MAG TPA: hypothetical protein VNT60_05095 [Deinococcales bacterium]|nr:hypothetical protein [Deinococcales bacterium]